MKCTPIDLKQRHVVITGASRGIGAALAREAAAQGARVTLVARKAESLQDLAQELDGYAYALDLSMPAAVAAAIDEIENTAGPIDVLINNAAFNETGPFIKRSEASLRTHVETNFYAPMELCRQLIPRMLERQRGSVVMISSIGGEIAIANTLLYNATKAGVNLFSSTLQRELKSTPVNILLVLLGAVDTDMLTAGMKDPLIAAFSKKFKTKPLTTEYVAEKVIAALKKGEHSLVLPSGYALLCNLRKIPTWFNDMAMKRVL
ncbi:SDR family NAD(P)-dependent oxidoreductase [Zhongshania marina]|uniref:SDR family NAD(P)-dependent oxidoreductase n=1 Tax=Zhongshania marina TaxID=2304603 RepID=A0ABX9W5R7_9GAMM|nr:SDR family NAD(P)-dependent oxidoreductase [Zhongshania marina]